MMTSSSLPVPLRTKATNPATRSTNATMVEIRLKTQLDDCERRRKNLVIQSQKVTRENEALQKKYKQLTSDHQVLKKENEQTKEELKELKRVSEAVYKEYETLSQRFNLETGAMHKAMQKATDWYKQNRALKRQSAIIVQKCLQIAPGSITDLDATAVVTSEKDDDELYDLRRSVKELSSEVAKLQVELNTVRLEEFEAQEELVEANAMLESEKAARTKAEHELAELKARASVVERLVSIEAEQLAVLRQQCEHEKQTATQMRKEANQAKKERNVLAHQSSLLLADVVGDERLHMLIMDIETLKAKLEDEANKHEIQVQELQNRINELESEGKIEVLEEKLKLAETELECEIRKLEAAVNTIEQLKMKVESLEKETNSGITVEDNVGGPPPPPPLPPPPPPFRDAPPVQHPINEMADMLGLKKTKQLQRSATLHGRAIDDIIDQIKGGRFQLKAIERQQGKQRPETPAAVQEMLHILGTMKRGPKKKTDATINNSMTSHQNLC